MAMEHSRNHRSKANGEGVIGVAGQQLFLKVFDALGGALPGAFGAVEYAAQIINDNSLPKDKCVST